MIEVNNLTLKYKSGKGIDNVDFTVKKGEAVGYLGPNGAGKTTTIRNLLGFTKPDSGSCSIDKLDCFKDAAKIQKRLGCIPGEIAFFEDMDGDEFLKFIGEMRGMQDIQNRKRLCERFELDTKGKIKRFSKGMKQKLGIVAAFMHNPDVYIFDEPSSGLDPIMQNRFVELVLEEKKQGKTILMSSHMFEEVERICDNVLIIKDGKIVVKNDIDTLKKAQSKAFIITPKNIQAFMGADNFPFMLKIFNENAVEVTLKSSQINHFLTELTKYEILDFDVKSQTLEEIFLHFYTEEVK